MNLLGTSADNLMKQTEYLKLRSSLLKANRHSF